MKNNNNLSSVETFSYPMPDLAQLIQSKIDYLECQGSDEAFFICDLGDIVKKFNTWKELLPRVEPFYAVKCNQDSQVVKLLADLGIGFDCASKGEIEQVLKYGVAPSRIIYANPCKQRSFLKYAAKHSVALMTFDSESELVKIKMLYPKAQCVLRILPTSQFKVQCELGNKFGCHPNNVLKLLTKAQELDLDVMGISFHVGSGVHEAEAFHCAVKQAYDAFQAGLELGFDMTMLDIGGGFPGQKSAPITFTEIAEVLNPALDKYFPVESGVRIIAEPGRYFVASAFVLTVNIIAKKAVARDLSEKEGPPDGHNCQELTSNDEPSFMYYVNDGLYGSFNSVMYDHACPKPSVLQDSPFEFTSSVWGPTCDGLDCIMEECRLPELEIGQWLYFKEMGAYTLAAGSVFNGMPRPERYFYCSASIWHEVYPESFVGKQKDGISSADEFPIMKSGSDIGSLRDSISCGRNHPEEECVVA